MRPRTHSAWNPVARCARTFTAWGEVLAADAKTYWRSSSGECTLRKKRPKDREYVRIGEEIPAARFAEGHEVVGQAGAELAPVFIDTADGAHGFESWHDVRRDVSCGFETEIDGTTVCAPESTQLEDESYSAFSGPDCATRVATGCTAKYGWDLPDIDAGAGAKSCVGETRYFELGEPVKAAWEHHDTSDDDVDEDGEPRQGPGEQICRSKKDPPDEGYVYQPVGARIPRSALPAETAMNPDPAAGRLTLTHARTTDGFLETNGWYDREARSECRFITAADGTTRCLPVAFRFLAEESPYFVDAACKRRALFNRPCDPQPPGFYVKEPGCSTHVHVFEALPPQQTNVRYSLNDGVCTKSTKDSPAEPWVAVPIGAEISPAKFLAVETIEK